MAEPEKVEEEDDYAAFEKVLNEKTKGIREVVKSSLEKVGNTYESAKEKYDEWQAQRRQDSKRKLEERLSEARSKAEMSRKEAEVWRLNQEVKERNWEQNILSRAMSARQQANSQSRYVSHSKRRKSRRAPMPERERSALESSLAGNSVALQSLMGNPAQKERGSGVSPPSLLSLMLNGGGSVNARRNMRQDEPSPLARILMGGSRVARERPGALAQAISGRKNRKIRLL